MGWFSKSQLVLCVTSLIVLELSFSDASKWKPPNETVYPDDFGPTGLYKLIENLGLEKEIYNVATEDGYILRLTRLVIPEKMNKTDKGIPMLMVNGLFLQSDGFLLHDKPIDNPAIYWLTHGYDIWLGDQRGTMRSREHKSYNANTDAKYWDFSFHEIGVYDLPAFIDFIIRKTDHKKVCYCGLSLSTTFAFVMLAEKPEYNDKIHIAIQFVPVADMPVLSTRTLATQLHFNLMSNIMYYYLMVNSPAFLMDMEKFRYHFHGLCSHIPHLFAWTMEQGAGGGLAMDINYLCKQMGMMYSTASVHTFLHTMQLFKYGEFRKYDVGKEENKQKYGEEIPPFYNYSKIVAPIALYFSDLDEYSPAYVVKRTVKKLGGPTYSCLIEQSHHVEALVGVQFGMHYNKDLIEVLDSATGRSSPDKLKSGTCNR